MCTVAKREDGFNSGQKGTHESHVQARVQQSEQGKQELVQAFAQIVGHLSRHLSRAWLLWFLLCLRLWCGWGRPEHGKDLRWWVVCGNASLPTEVFSVQFGSNGDKVRDDS